MVVSDPVLQMLGIHYSGEEGHFYEKIHPGTALILLSFPALLCDRVNPVVRFSVLYRQQKVPILLLALYIILLLYMGARSGFAGLAFIIDTHMTAVICAIVFSYAPQKLCRVAVHFFILAAVFNAMTGIAEAVFQFRVLTFDAEWPVLHEPYFRASAFIGHPLDNAVFTVVALFVMLALDYPVWIKGMVCAVFLAALMAFGGRAGLLFAAAGLVMLTVMQVWRLSRSGHFSWQAASMAFAGMIALPLLGVALFCLVTHSHVGERILASANWDSSANSRLLAFRVFSYMSSDDFWFGMSGARIMQVVNRINASLPVSDIENPWLLMFMYLGFIAFPFWLVATMAFAWRLMKDQPFALLLAVVAYYGIASTSNTFGRKDANYAIMVTAVICTARMIKLRSGATQAALPLGR